MPARTAKVVTPFAIRTSRFESRILMTFTPPNFAVHLRRTNGPRAEEPANQVKLPGSPGDFIRSFIGKVIVFR